MIISPAGHRKSTILGAGRNRALCSGIAPYRNRVRQPYCYLSSEQQLAVSSQLTNKQRENRKSTRRSIPVKLAAVRWRSGGFFRVDPFSAVVSWVLNRP